MTTFQSPCLGDIQPHEKKCNPHRSISNTPLETSKPYYHIIKPKSFWQILECYHNATVSLPLFTGTDVVYQLAYLTTPSHPSLRHWQATERDTCILRATTDKKWYVLWRRLEPPNIGHNSAADWHWNMLLIASFISEVVEMFLVW